jgi:hypothetical protein
VRFGSLGNDVASMESVVGVNLLQQRQTLSLTFGPFYKLGQGLIIEPADILFYLLWIGSRTAISFLLEALSTNDQSLCSLHYSLGAETCNISYKICIVYG